MYCEAQILMLLIQVNLFKTVGQRLLRQQCSATSLGFLIISKLCVFLKLQRDDYLKHLSVMF